MIYSPWLDGLIVRSVAPKERFEVDIDVVRALDIRADLSKSPSLGFMYFVGFHCR